MTMRWGVLGSGYWASETHCAGLAASSDAELVGVWGRDPAKADAVAARWGASGYPYLDQLLAEVDAVSIAVPPDIQVPLAIRAAQAGRHLLLEKPIALDLVEADQLVDAIDQAGVASVVFFALRLRPQVAQWLSEIRDRRDWQTATGRWLNSGTFDDGSPWAGSEWRKQRGGLWDLTPHLLSLAIPALGDVRSVTAQRGPSDLTHLVLTHESGASGTYSTSLALDKPTSTLDLDIFGPAGARHLPEDPSTFVELFQLAVVELTRAVVADRVSEVGIGLGRQIVAVLQAADQAIATGRTIEL